MFFKAVLIYFCFIKLFFDQVNSEIVAHDLKCPVHNSKYLKDVDVFFYSDNDLNEFFANFTIVKSFPHDAIGHVKAVQRSDTGIYNVRTDFEFSRQFCETVNKPSSYFWFNIHAYIFDECPAKPGNYIIERFILIDREHETFFKTYLQTEKYMIIFYVTHKKETIFYCHVHYDIN